MAGGAVRALLIFSLGRRAFSPEAGRWLAAGLVLEVTALVIAPVTVRNRVVGGEWVQISHNARINLYIGNNPDYDRTTNTRPGRAWQELGDMPKREAGVTTRGAASRFFFRRSWDYFTADPADFALL